MRRLRKAKIVATLGPASSDPAMIRRLFEAGADVFRLNFSHGTHEDHKRRFDAIRALETGDRPADRHPAGPAGPEDPRRHAEGGSGQARARRRTCASASAAEPGDASEVPLPHPEVIRNVMPGHTLMIDDGKLQLDGDGLRRRPCRCQGRSSAACCRDRKGVNLPEHRPADLAADRQGPRDLAFGLDLGVDWVALSFVQRPADVIEAQGADQRPRRHHGQDREAGRARAHRGHRRPGRRGHGGARRSRRRDPARGRAGPAEGADPAVPAGRQAGDRGDADARIDDQVAVADAGRGLRRRDRHLRQRRRGDAVGGIGLGRLAGRGGRR